MVRHQRGLILSIGLLLVIGFLITSLASFFAARASLRAHIAESELPLTSDNIYSEVQRDLLRPITISSVMATDTFLRDWLLNGERDPSQITRYLKAIQQKYDTLTSFLVSEKTRTYYQADGILKTVDPDAWRDVWYFRVREMDADYEINVDPDMANRDTMTIFINYRVYDYDGNFIGATGVGLAVSALKSIIEEYQQEYNRRIYFTDEQGTVQLCGTDFPAEIDNIKGIEGLRPLADDILSQPSGSFRYQRDGKTIHLNTRRIDEFDWCLLVEQSESPAVRGIANTLIMNLAICGVVIAVVLGLTFATLRAYQRRIEAMATTDKLTGVYNRRAFDLLAPAAMLDADRNQTPLSIILLDFDHFKTINDRFGHVAGDQVLERTAGVLRSNIRASDILCRWGGEEFLILLKRCALEDAHRMAESLRRAVADTLTPCEGGEIRATVSLGVTQYCQGEDDDSMIRRADTALYAAKRNGRNRTEVEVPPTPTQDT
jgi:diguanylate cyclase (GGDEF)-like protein